MERRVGLLFLFLFGACWACGARQLGETELSGKNVDSVLLLSKQEQKKVSEPVEEFAQNENLCTLCEEYATKAVDYFANNKTQTEIMDMLRLSCSHLPTLKEKISVERSNLCQQVVIFSSQLNEDSCALCHHTVAEVLSKLENPDTQMEIIEVLLKACNSMDKYAIKCKKMVFEYGPLILTNTEQFLETTDICTILHACKSSAADGNDAAAAELVPVLADS